MLEDPDFWTLFAICLAALILTVVSIFSEKAFDPPEGLKGIRILPGEKDRLVVLSVAPDQARAGYYIAFLRDPANPHQPTRIDRWPSRDEVLAFRARPEGELIVCALTYGPNGELLEVPLEPTNCLSIDASLLIR